MASYNVLALLQYGDELYGPGDTADLDPDLVAGLPPLWPFPDAVPGQGVVEIAEQVTKRTKASSDD